MPPKKSTKEPEYDEGVEERLREQNYKVTIHNLRAEVSALKQQLLQQERKFKQQLESAHNDALEKNTILSLLAKYRRVKETQNRSGVGLPSGIVLGRPEHFRGFFKEDDVDVAKSFFIPRSEFGHKKNVPLFPQAAEEELQELSSIHSIWLLIKDRFEELTKAKDRFLAYEEARKAPERSTQWQTVMAKAAIAPPPSVSVGQKRQREDEEKE